DAGEKPTSATVYELGSISKVFTSLLLADAVSRGAIKLNAPAEVKNAAGIQLPSREGHAITWLELSTHRSGLPRLPANLNAMDLVNPYHDYDSKKAAEFLNTYDLPRLPGEKQEYSNLGVAVLGYLLAEKAGKPYEQLLKERIAEPLKLTDCVVTLSDNQKKRLATPHDRFGTVTSTWDFSDIPGEGGIHATMRDMMRFAKAQLEPPKGTLGEAIELAWQKHTDVDASGAAMGLGWMIAGDGETRWHNGGTGGYRTALFISRKFNCAAIVLCNRAVDSEVDELAAKIVRKAASAATKVAGSDRNKSAPKVSPFTDVQFEGEQVNVVYDGQHYQLLELDSVKVEDLVSSSKKMFGDLWQKRISEDLAELLMRMGHRPGNTVKLRLREVTTKQDTVVDSAPMTEANRSAIFAKRLTDTEGNKTSIDAALRGRLVGRYQLTPDFIFDVQDKDGHLMVGITNQPTQEVFPDTPTRWSYHSVDATLEFKLPKTGPAKNVVLHQNGIDQTAFRIEDKAGGHKKVEVDAKTRGRLVGQYQLAPNFIFDVQDKDGHLMVGVTNQPTAEV
ncbi:MAG TPA: serine hydrolase domain-containing protein, partial [Pirellulales bacterium]